MASRDSSVSYRQITGPEELDLFLTLSCSLDHELRGDLSVGFRRPEWMWVALRDGQLLARVAWWGPAQDTIPSVLDVLDLADAPDRIEVGTELLRAALARLIPTGVQPPDYVRFIPSNWRASAASRQVVEDRMAVAYRTGARLLVERLRLEWLPGSPIGVKGDRVIFRPVSDDGELVDLMTLVMAGTLDAHSGDDLTRMSAREGAIRHFEDELARYRSPRAWWRIAARPDGVPVGFVIPARNDYHAILAYLGVVPDQRGHGYVDELLAEGARILAAAGVPRIRASTDLGNVPMAQAFARAGWSNFERSINMTWG
ncbi:MAG: GNAT family N-acetyltransferase [Candidatus Dormibacteria bacterium]